LDREREAAAHELRSAVRSACVDLGGVVTVRGADGHAAEGWDKRAWDVIARQIGVAALGLPEKVGGAGGLPELAVVAEELGAALLPVPFLSSALAGQVLSACGDAALPVLQEMADGATAVVSGLLGPGRAGQPRGSVARDEAGRLRGTTEPLVDVVGARWLVLAAADEVCLVDLLQPGVTLEPVATLDLTRPAARVTLAGSTCTIVGEAAPMRTGPVLDAATVVLAAEQLGGAQRCLDTTVGYVSARRQFGRPVGSFQAVKHALADVLVLVEMSRSAVVRAVEAHDDAAALTEAALVARIWCSDAYRTASAEAIQLHGGIGFTWEHDAHLYFRRARADAVMFGGPSDAREALAALLGW